MNLENVEWNEEKRKANIEKHGIDFSDAAKILTRRHICGPSKYEGKEQRWIAIGELFPPGSVPENWSGPLAVVVYTLRGGYHRIISARRARTDERRYYYDGLG
mgnify:CR=1 FL=1